jgi:hypothetical protein
VSSVVGEFRFNLFRSPDWEGDESKLQQGLKEIRNASIFAIIIALIFIIVGAIGVSLTTRNLDDRMIVIVQGISSITCAVILVIMSFEAPKRTGVYYSRVHEEHGLPVGKCLKALRFHVLWSIWGQFGFMYFLLWPFYCSSDALTISISIMTGIALGLFLVGCIYFARRHTERRNKICTGIMAVCLTIASGAFFANGCVFISLVWADDYDWSIPWDVIIFVLWCFVACLFHCYFIWRSKKFMSMKKQLTGVGGEYDNDATKEMKLESGKVKKWNDNDDKTEIDDEGSEYGDDDDDGTIETGDDNDKANSHQNEDVDAGVQLEDAEYQGDKGESEKDPNTCSLLKEKFRCFWCIRGKAKPGREKFYACGGWTIRVLLVTASLFFTVVNIGATKQGKIVQAKLPSVHEEVYRDMDFGEVCAFDDKGADSNIMTFPDKEAAHAAGFLVLHCGACGHCSDWHNLRLEYTTRTFLEKEAKKCALKSFFGGKQAVIDCLQAPEPINIQGECAVCWATDILCAKANCTFIYLQSTMIDAKDDFSVGPDTVTSASCEEAHCEAGQFVPCSGATRRRMNVKSSIERPGGQRCSIVDVDWAALFPEGA